MPNPPETATSIQYHDGPGGLPFATIENAQATAEVSLHGGHVTAFQPKSASQPVLWLSGQAVFDPNKAIRGGIPVCWPWFGDHPTDAGLPAHGFARTSPWKVTNESSNADGSTTLALQLSATTPVPDVWPHRATLLLEITVGEALSIRLTTTNTGDAPFPLTQALHTYFTVSDISNVTIAGLEGARYLDKLKGNAAKPQDGVITIDQEVDRVYTETTADCLIHDPGFDRTIRIAKSGSRSTVVWNPWIEKAKRMGDFPDDGYQTMVCVETTNVGEDDTVTVEPGASHTLAAVISIEAV